MNKVDPNPALNPRHSPERASVQPTRIRSEVLLGDDGEIVIEHAGRDYHLRVTQNGKLILTA